MVQSRETLFPRRWNNFVERIIRSDNALQSLLVVYDGHGDQIVFGNYLGDVVLAIGELDADDPAMHEIFD